jgi:hypothetical protein
MSNELVLQEEKSIVVMLDLVSDTQQERHQAYVALSELGFNRVAQNVLLPTRLVIGTWFKTNSVEEIRDTLAVYFAKREIRIVSLFVAEIGSCAFAGTPLP